MLEFVIFAVTFVVVLLSTLFYLYPGSRRQTTIDGLDPSHPTEGNVGDVIKAKSFHNFLVELHQKFGEIASFWLFGPTLAVSIWSNDVLKSLDYMTEKPKEVNQIFESFLGKNSIVFAQKHDFRKQRSLWELMFVSKSIESQTQVIKELISELINKWSTLPERQHISVGHYMKAFTLRLSLITGFGNYFKKSNSDLIDFSRSFEYCFTELESRLLGDSPSAQNLRDERFQQSVDKCRQILRKAIEEMKNSASVEDNYGLLKHIANDSSISSDKLIDESMTYVMMYYSLSSALNWTLYYLSSETELQSKMSQNLSPNNPLIDKFIDCSLSSANVIQWTSRVNPDVDIQVDKHIVPKGTPIICCLSSDQFLNSDYESPLDLFRQHFESSEGKLSLPFGSSRSKRCCPAVSYSKFVIKALITEILTKFEVQSIDSDLIPQQIYGIYSRSEDEIWVTIKKRE